MSAGTEPFRPSNGTEGACFVDSWCGQCERGTRRDCPILGATYAYDVDEPEYPKEWIRDSHGPRCTAFVHLGGPLPTPRCTDTADMFPEVSHHE